MEIKRKAVGGGILTAFWRGLLVTAVLFAGGILLASALLYSGMVMEEQMLVLLYAVFAAASFGGTAASPGPAPWQRLAQGVLAQGIFLSVLAAVGVLLRGGAVCWPRLALVALTVSAAALAAALLFGKKKKKKFQKNPAIRLKKK